MKISIVSGLNESKSTPEAVNKKFESLLNLLKPLKYDGIELSLLEPEKVNIAAINEIKESYDMEISALGTGSTFIRFGYSLGHHEQSYRDKAIERIDKYIDFAVGTDSKVIIGLIRGRYSIKNNPKKEKLNIIASLRECCRMAENKGIDLLFEPINRFEIDSFNTIADSVELLDEIGSERLKLLIDSFHTHLEEDPGFVWDYLKKVAHHAGHLHLADCTRRAPGTGHFDFKAFLNVFRDAGFDGYASAETIMKPSFEDVAKETAEYLRLIL